MNIYTIVDRMDKIRGYIRTDAEEGVIKYAWSEICKDILKSSIDDLVLHLIRGGYEAKREYLIVVSPTFKNQ